MPLLFCQLRFYQSMNARQLALRCLTDWQPQNPRTPYAEEIFSLLAGEWNLTGSDRGFARELFYGVLRNRSALDHIIARFAARPPAQAIQAALQLGIYQILFLRTPAHAAVSATVDLVDRPRRGFVNGVLRNVVREIVTLEKNLADLPLSMRFSHPEFLVENWIAQFGLPITQKLLDWNNTPAEVFLRRNTLVPPDTHSLNDLVPTAHPLVFRAPKGLPGNLVSGEFYAQDPSTLVAPEMLAPLPHEHILDACAAPGGKTTFLAALLGNAGQITATDSDPRRLERLAANIARLQVTNTTLLPRDWSQPQPVSDPLYDAILADVPCSNTGVMRRRIDVRWRIQPDTSAEFAWHQNRILDHLAPHLRPGGRLIYSTCSLEKIENEEVVASFLNRHPAFQLVRSESRFPWEHGCDGSFAAFLSKKE